MHIFYTKVNFWSIFMFKTPTDIINKLYFQNNEIVYYFDEPSNTIKTGTILFPADTTLTNDYNFLQNYYILSIDRTVLEINNSFIFKTKKDANTFIKAQTQCEISKYKKQLKHYQKHILYLKEREQDIEKLNNNRHDRFFYFNSFRFKSFPIHFKELTLNSLNKEKHIKMAESNQFNKVFVYPLLKNYSYYHSQPDYIPIFACLIDGLSFHNPENANKLFYRLTSIYNPLESNDDYFEELCHDDIDSNLIFSNPYTMLSKYREHINNKIDELSLKIKT